MCVYINRGVNKKVKYQSSEKQQQQQQKPVRAVSVAGYFFFFSKQCLTQRWGK